MVSGWKPGGSKPRGEGDSLGKLSLHGTFGQNSGAPKPAPARSRFVIKPSKMSCIVLGSLTGLVAACAVGLYVWQSGEIADLAQKVKDKQAALANSVKISHDLQTVTATNLQTRGDLQHLETSVTEGHYIPTLLHQTEELAKSTNLHVAALRPTLEAAPTPPPDKELAKKFVAQPYDKEHIELDLTGRYWDLAQLLYKLTVFPKIMTVESVGMSPANTGPGDKSKLNAKVRLTGFIFKTDAAASPAPTGGAAGAPGVAGATIAPASSTPAAAATPSAAKSKV